MSAFIDFLKYQINSTELKAVMESANEGYLSESNRSLDYSIRSQPSEFACLDPFFETNNKTSDVQVRLNLSRYFFLSCQ